MDWYKSESDKSIVSTNSQRSTDKNDNLAAVTSDNNIPVSGLHCTLLSFISKHRSGQTAVTTGWINESPYVLPLHKLSVVPGHMQQHMAICDTDTTKLHMIAFVAVHMHVRDVYTSSG
jgi:hypothetical protein